MQVNENVLRTYINETPLALAFERTVESRIYSKLILNRPILDIGCGEGLFAKIVFSEPLDTGIDPDPSELNQARTHGGYRELIQCWGDSIPKPDGSYQTIISNSVLEHIKDLKPVLQEAYRLLAPGGKFYFTVPSDQFERYTWIHLVLSGLGLKSFAERYRAFFNRFWRHYHCYPLKTWEALGREAGFEVTVAYTYNSKKLCLLNDLLAPFAIILFVAKRMTNRWILFPRIRKITSFPFYLAAKKVLIGGEVAREGGLVFVALEKKAK
jgi:SAM-dependent methyltransferase